MSKFVIKSWKLTSQLNFWKKFEKKELVFQWKSQLLTYFEIKKCQQKICGKNMQWKCSTQPKKCYFYWKVSNRKPTKITDFSGNRNRLFEFPNRTEPKPTIGKPHRTVTDYFGNRSLTTCYLKTSSPGAPWRLGKTSSLFTKCPYCM